MAALIIRLPDGKRERLKDLARARKQSVDMVQPEHVRHVPALAVPESESSWGRRDPPRITLQVADGALLAELAVKLAREQARSHALLDEIADLNREKLELEVAPELNEIAGLAA